MLFWDERVEFIRQKLKAHQPEFVGFYSPDNGVGRRYADAWNAITGQALERDVPVRVGQTICVMTYHPNGERSKEYWRGIAEAITQNQEHA
ncbi:MAG: hypothetical protein NVS2B17_26000 [Candidatus Velthaea sp.]